MLYELSERPRILLIGADGQLGWELRRTASPLGDVFATVANDSRRRNVSGELLDIADHGAIRRVVADVKPHVILNAAAFTDIDQTERESAVATAINGVAPGLLAREASRYEALLVHYSTDNVFDGELDRPYRPSDSPRPANTYGATKLQGEEAIRAIGGPHLILRTSWLYGVARQQLPDDHARPRGCGPSDLGGERPVRCADLDPLGGGRHGPDPRARAGRRRGVDARTLRHVPHDGGRALQLVRVRGRHPGPVPATGSTSSPRSPRRASRRVRGAPRTACSTARKSGGRSASSSTTGGSPSSG